MTDDVYSWYNTDKEKPKYLEKGLSQCHLVHHKSHMERIVPEAAPPQ
jgi:hypothetical protein